MIGCPEPARNRQIIRTVCVRLFYSIHLSRCGLPKKCCVGFRLYFHLRRVRGKETWAHEDCAVRRSGCWHWLRPSACWPQPAVAHNLIRHENKLAALPSTTGCGKSAPRNERPQQRGLTRVRTRCSEPRCRAKATGDS